MLPALVPGIFQSRCTERTRKPPPSVTFPVAAVFTYETLVTSEAQFFFGLPGQFKLTGQFRITGHFRLL